MNITWKTEMVLILCGFCTFLSFSAFVSILHIIQEYYHFTKYQTSLLLSLTPLSCGLFSIISGYLCDKFSYKKILICGLCIFGISGFFCFNIFENIYIVSILRLLLGIGNAMILAGVFTCVGQNFDSHKRKVFYSRYSVATSFSIIGVTYLFSTITKLFSWQRVGLAFLILIPIFEIVKRTLPDNSEETEKNKNDIKIPITQLPIKTFLIPWIILISFSCFYCIMTLLPFKLRSLGYSSPYVVAKFISMGSILTAFFSYLYKSLFKNVESYKVQFISIICMVIGFTLVKIDLTDNQFETAIFVIGFLMLFVAFGFSPPSMTFWMLENVPHQYIGRLNGIITCCIYLGAFCSSAVMWIFGKSLILLYLLILVLFCLVRLAKKYQYDSISK